MKAQFHYKFFIKININRVHTFKRGEIIYTQEVEKKNFKSRNEFHSYLSGTCALPNGFFGILQSKNDMR